MCETEFKAFKDCVQVSTFSALHESVPFMRLKS